MMVLNTLDSSKMISSMDKASISGLMVKFISEDGKMESSMEKES